MSIAKIHLYGIITDGKHDLISERDYSVKSLLHNQPVEATCVGREAGGYCGKQDGKFSIWCFSNPACLSSKLLKTSSKPNYIMPTTTYNDVMPTTTYNDIFTTNPPDLLYSTTTYNDKEAILGSHKQHCDCTAWQEVTFCQAQCSSYGVREMRRSCTEVSSSYCPISKLEDCFNDKVSSLYQLLIVG